MIPDLHLFSIDNGGYSNRGRGGGRGRGWGYRGKFTSVNVYAKQYIFLPALLINLQSHGFKRYLNKHLCIH